MCGICGQFNFGDRAPVVRQDIKAMADTIVHRGPDDEGYLVSGPIGLGFRRLSIIDLAGGHQPMADAEETVWVIFNGEIYNFRELRRELESRGHRFRTSSRHRSDRPRLQGSGAPASSTSSTACSASRSGTCGGSAWSWPGMPWGSSSSTTPYGTASVWFGSEMRPVLAALGLRPEVDPVALNLFLRYRYTPSPLTIFQGIEKLAPGTMLVVENGQARRERWYRYTPVPFPTPKGEDEACEELVGLYRDAMRRHLISDVPVGLLLSGGIDSGLLLALMNEQGGPWPAYTVGYGESFEDDELADAAETALVLGARHVQVKLDREEFERSLPRIVECLEEPIATSSIVPMYFVSQRARQDVKVALIGQGPDELFGGYKRHLGVRYGDYWRLLPRPVRSVRRLRDHALAPERDAEAGRALARVLRSARALPARVLPGAGRDRRWALPGRTPAAEPGGPDPRLLERSAPADGAHGRARRPPAP